ncbi:flagellar hook-length control protein FliK [Geomesophilobacter sediminis]|uniref:Flagellar hook-length control protein FliK n=1 Tax=Geomesophilobacter sediminis TaxID=2798584 RepID=A0A8J7JEY5_9BACT|nr:flagellar hook-length control protein FliK [Geomesophilobacter sediminis]MBJ6724749.1 flagellar hook-length control protein FliK [Geomesophilobacter sediminis]
MIPNVLLFQPEAAPAVLPSTGRGAAPLSSSDSGSFAGILQVKLPGQGDSPAPTANGTDGGSAAPTLSASPQAAPDQKENSATKADPATANAGGASAAAADSATPATTPAAPQPIPQFATVGMGNVIRFPSQQVVVTNRQEAIRQAATPDAETASAAQPVVDAEIAVPAKPAANDDPTPATKQKNGDKETAADAASNQAAPVIPPVAAIPVAPAPQMAALAAALAVPVSATTTAPQQDGNAATAATETVAAASPSAMTLPASKNDVPASGAALPQDTSAATATAPTVPVAGAAQPVAASASAPGFIPANEARPVGQPSLQEDRPVPFFPKAAQFQGERTVSSAATSGNGTGKVQSVQNPDATSLSQMIREPRAEQAAAPAQPAVQTATPLANQAVSDTNAGVGMAAGGQVATGEEVSHQNRQVAAPVPENSGTKIAASGAARVEVTAASAPVADSKPIVAAPVTVSVQQTAAPAASQEAAATTAAAQQQAAVTTAAVPQPAAQQAGPAPDAVRETAVTAREQRSARMVRDIYGSGFRASKAQQDDSAQHQATQELRDTGVPAQKADATAAEVSKNPAPTGNAEATAPAPAQIQTVKAQPVVAGSAALPQADTEVRESAEAAASQPVETGKAAEATGGVTQAKGTVRDTATAAAVGGGRGELKQEERSQEQPEVKVAQAGTANTTAKPENGSNGGFSNPEQKEQHDQKHQVKEQTQAQQPLGIATPQQQVEAPAPAPKSAAATTTLHESILSQIKDGVAVHDGKGNGQISIRLNPGELGELKIQVRMDDGNKVRVEVQADNKTVKDLLLSNVQSLKETLAAKNFTMEGFDVSTGSRDSFNNPNNNPLADDRQQQQQRSTTRSASLSYSDGVEPVRVNYLTGDVNNLLDVRF